MSSIMSFQSPWKIQLRLDSDYFKKWRTCDVIMMSGNISMNSYSWSHVPAFRQNQFRNQMGNLERFVIIIKIVLL